MSVSIPRSEYTEALEDWHRTQCALGGRSAVMANIQTFLPMMESHRKSPDLYKIYTQRAFWYGGASRTIDAWVGTLTRKPLTVEVPDPYRPRLENIDGQGTSIDAFARNLVREVCAYGRVGILVDSSPDGDEGPKTSSYLAMYTAQNIISWRTRSTLRGNILDQVILKEEIEEPHHSGFGVEKRMLYRVLELDEEGFYRQRLFSMQGGEPIEQSMIYPSRRERTGFLDFIPFTIVGPTTNLPQIEKAPIQDVIDANISHFQTSADYEFALYWSASPTAVVTGLTPSDNEDEEPRQVGGGVIWNLPAGATAQYLEFKGHGLSALQDALTTKQQLMASLGASLLNNPKREVETAEALTIKTNGESASLVTIADSVSKALTASLKTACFMVFVNGPVNASLNRDLINVRLKPDDLRALMLLVQAGLLSLDDYYFNLQQGEILRPGITIEDAKNAAMMQGPIFSAPLNPPPTKREIPPEEEPKAEDVKPADRKPRDAA